MALLVLISVGWHEFVKINTTNVKYAVITDTETCPESCDLSPYYQDYQYNLSPNNNWEADGMVNILAHELSEIMTDPLPSVNIGWTDINHYEIADKCVWTFGNAFFNTKNCSIANVTIGNYDYMIQRNWDLNSADPSASCKLNVK